MLKTTIPAPRTQADAMLAITEAHPEISLDVAEDPADPDTYLYTFFLPENLQPALAAFGPLSFSTVEENVDYVALTRASFPPLTVGSFFIARNGEPTPPGLIGLTVTPNRAFGSGEHATTTGCLMAYQHLTQAGNPFTTGLDYGAGSGILALAAAKQHSTLFLCLDNDPPSVEICAQNARANGVAAFITSAFAKTPPTGQAFPLIFANILMQPLVDMAPALAACLEKSPHAALILSGFTTDQADAIAAAYRPLGLRHTWQHEQQGWLAQVWQWA